jgi:hypothetical protein
MKPEIAIALVTSTSHWTYLVIDIKVKRMGEGRKGRFIGPFFGTAAFIG